MLYGAAVGTLPVGVLDAGHEPGALSRAVPWRLGL